MTNKIDNIEKEEYKSVVELWESSVRATHHFLKEEDIEYYKPLILNTYLDAVELRCIRNNGKIVGFLGVADQNLEMLFIDPEYSISQLNVTKIDVNEQNEQAVGFYKHCGFETIKRSKLDSSGKPYPTLHMELKK